MSEGRDYSSIFRRVGAAAIGGVAAAFAGPMIAAYGGMYIGTVGASLVGSTITTISRNAMQPALEVVHYRPEESQRMFRDPVSRFLEHHLEPIIEAIRRNRAADFGPVSFSASTHETHHIFSLAFGQDSSITIKYMFRVRPRAGPRRGLSDGKPPPDLPNNTDPDQLDTYLLPEGLAQITQTLYDGLAWSVAKGAAVGLVGSLCLPLAPGWYFFETAPGVSGIVLGMPSVVGGVSSATELGNLSPYHNLTYSVLFATEMRLHVNRVVQCALQNEVDLEYQIEAGISSSMSATVDMNDAQQEAHAVNQTRVFFQDQSQLF